MSLNSRCPSWFHSNSLLLNSIHFNGRHQKSYQEKKQTIFSGTSLRTHLCARSSCCFHQISKDDLLYSFCFSLLIIQSQQSARIFLQREGHLVIEPAYFPVLSRTSLSFETGGRHPHLASGLDFWNALDSSKAPACLSTVNPHGPSVSFTDSLVKKKKNTKPNVKFKYDWEVHLVSDCLETYCSFLQNYTHVLPSSWAHLEFHSFGSNQMTAVCQKTARSPSNRYAKELNEENSFEPKIEFSVTQK